MADLVSKVACIMDQFYILECEALRKQVLQLEAQENRLRLELYLEHQTNERFADQIVDAQVDIEELQRSVRHYRREASIARGQLREIMRRGSETSSDGSPTRRNLLLEMDFNEE